MVQAEGGAAPVDDTKATTRGTPRPKSTIRFPYYDLADAIVIVREIHDNVANHECSLELLARYLNHKSVDSGAFRLRLAAGSMFGLIEPASGKVRLTDRARALLSMHPDEEQQALSDAFLDVELFRRVYEQYQGRQLPPDIGLKNVLKDLGVVPNQIDRALSTLLRSATTAGFRDSGERYLVAPPLAARGTRHLPDEGTGTARAEPSNSGAQTQTGGDGPPPPPTGIHPALMGLLQLLPPAQAPWKQGKQEWLTAFTAAIDAIYPDLSNGSQAEGQNGM